jgi:hypothetical protein
VPRNVAIRYILPEKYLTVLGEIALASAQLEYTVGSHISMLLNLSPVASDCLIPANLFNRLDAPWKIGSERIRSKKETQGV